MRDALPVLLLSLSSGRGWHHTCRILTFVVDLAGPLVSSSPIIVRMRFSPRQEHGRHSLVVSGSYVFSPGYLRHSLVYGNFVESQSPPWLGLFLFRVVVHKYIRIGELHQTIKMALVLWKDAGFFSPPSQVVLYFFHFHSSSIEQADLRHPSCIALRLQMLSVRHLIDLLASSRYDCGGLP